MKDKPTKTIIVHPKVINLLYRDLDLSENEIQILSKGLKYTPTPKENDQELKTHTIGDYD